MTLASMIYIAYLDANNFVVFCSVVVICFQYLFLVFFLNCEYESRLTRVKNHQTREQAVSCLCFECLLQVMNLQLSVQGEGALKFENPLFPWIGIVMLSQHEIMHFVEHHQDAGDRLPIDFVLHNIMMIPDHFIGLDFRMFSIRFFIFLSFCKIMHKEV